MSFRTIELAPPSLVAPFASGSPSLWITETLGCSFTDVARYRRIAFRYLDTHPELSRAIADGGCSQQLMYSYGDLNAKVQSINLDKGALRIVRMLAKPTASNSVYVKLGLHIPQDEKRKHKTTHQLMQHVRASCNVLIKI